MESNDGDGSKKKKDVTEFRKYFNEEAEKGITFGLMKVVEWREKYKIRLIGRIVLSMIVLYLIYLILKGVGVI